MLHATEAVKHPTNPTDHENLYTDMFHKIASADVAGVQTVLKNELFDIHHIFNEGNTVLHLACDPKSPDASHTQLTKIVEVLLLHGASVYAENHERHTPLICALHHKSFNICQLLLQHEADPNFDNGKPLRDAQMIERFHVQFMRLLLQHGANPNTRDEELDCTALHLAVAGAAISSKKHFYLSENAQKKSQNKEDMALILSPNALQVSLLLQHGADVSAVNGNLATPLHLAARTNSVDVVKSLLLMCDRDVIDMKNIHGGTALHNAGREGDPRIVQCLINAGANIHAICNKDRKTPVDQAYTSGRYESMEVLVKAGALVNPKLFKSEPKIDKPLL
jgi:ankyrin repeat protein